jgi:hypothetical protein
MVEENRNYSWRQQKSPSGTVPYLLSLPRTHVLGKDVPPLRAWNHADALFTGFSKFISRILRMQENLRDGSEGRQLCREWMTDFPVQAERVGEAA